MACKNPVTVTVTPVYSANVADRQKYSVLAWDCYGQLPTGGIPTNAILDFTGTPILSFAGDYLTTF